MAVFSEASLMLDWKGDRCLQFARHLQETVRNGVRQRGGREKKKKSSIQNFFFHAPTRGREARPGWKPWWTERHEENESTVWLKVVRSAKGAGKKQHQSWQRRCMRC